MPRPDAPCLPQLEDELWHEALHPHREVWRKEGGAYNIFKTLAGHPQALKRWMVFANHVLFKSSLGVRDREILILRIGWLCQAEYEFAQHVLIAKRAGITAEEIARIKQGPGAPGWAENERLLLVATGELHADACITDATWDALKAHYSEQQMVDIVMTVGNYTLVSMLLNTLGVPLDDFLAGSFAE